MRYVPLSETDKSCLEDWFAKANDILDELKAEPDAKMRKVIIYRNKRHWRDLGLLDFLKDLSNGKCWYTEARFTAEYPHLEHFRPKSYARKECGEKCHDGYWWLAFNIENYRLSKPMPNTKKGTYFPLRERAMAVCEPDIAVSRESPMFIDPTDEDDSALISFNALGEPEPCNEPPVDLNDWDKLRIEFSIMRYGLDNRDLCNQRKALWRAVHSQCDEYINHATKAKEERCDESKGRAKQVLKNLRKYLAPEHEFTALIHDCFNNHKAGRGLYTRLLAM